MKLFPLHDIREYQCTSRLQNPLHLRHQHDSVCSVAQRLLAPHKVVLVRPVVGQALIERTLCTVFPESANLRQTVFSLCLTSAFTFAPPRHFQNLLQQ
jgi:hypothetical protein